LAAAVQEERPAQEVEAIQEEAVQEEEADASKVLE